MCTQHVELKPHVTKATQGYICMYLLVCTSFLHGFYNFVHLFQVVLRTLQTTNSTRFRHLIDELFAHGAFSVSEFSYFVDPQDGKRRGHTSAAKVRENREMRPCIVI